MGCHSVKGGFEKYSIDLDATPKSPQLFGKNVISTQFYERDMAISPKRDEIVFTRGDHKQNYRVLVSIKRSKGQWGKPEILNISGVYQDIEPFFANNGDRLYFVSNRPIYGDSTRSDYNIWYTDRIGSAWADPVSLDSAINTPDDEFYPSISSKGNLFFTATRVNGVGKEDIFVSELVDGKYHSPEPLPVEINTSFYEFNAFVSPNEDYIIFSSYGRGDDLGRGDLYISEKDSSGEWMESRNLGSEINSSYLDFCPFVDWEGRNLYFTSERGIAVDSEIKNMEELQRIFNRIENGFGNIYQVSFEELNLVEK